MRLVDIIYTTDNVATPKGNQTVAKEGETELRCLSVSMLRAMLAVGITTGTLSLVSTCIVVFLLYDIDLIIQCACIFHLTL